MSITSLFLSCIPQVVFDGLHTLSYEFAIFQETTHFEQHEQGIDHDHDLLTALDKSKDSQSPSKPLCKKTTKLHKIKEPQDILSVSLDEELLEHHSFLYQNSYSDSFLATLLDPPDLRA